MARQLDDFIQGYLQYTKNSESPTTYHLWSAIGCISAALERRVSMQWGHTRVFPNQYICLIGPSGARKGEPIVIAQEMVEAVGVSLVAEAITKQALIRRIKESLSHFDDGKMQSQCAVSVVSEEFATFLGDNDAGFLADLTNWYDSRGSWTYDTKHSGTDEIVGVCVNILASMAPDWIPLCIPQVAIGGGFTSRILFVVEHRKGKTISDPNLYSIDQKLGEALKRDLERIKKLVGEIAFDPEAKEAYKAWYEREEVRNQKGQPALKDPRFAGYVNRRATHIKKIAMACSASRSDDLFVLAADFDRARLFMESAEKNMESVFGKIGSSPLVAQTQEIMDFIRQKKSVPKWKVMQAFYRDVDDKMMDSIEATLRATKLVKKTIDSAGNVVYKWMA